MSAVLYYANHFIEVCDVLNALDSTNSGTMLDTKTVILEPTLQADLVYIWTRLVGSQEQLTCSLENL